MKPLAVAVQPYRCYYRCYQCYRCTIELTKKDTAVEYAKRYTLKGFETKRKRFETKRKGHTKKKMYCAVENSVYSNVAL